jgi:hypothetical protein
MQNNSFTRWFLLWFLATVLLLGISLGIRVAVATGRAGGTPASDARLDMITALRAMSSNPDMRLVLDSHARVPK